MRVLWLDGAEADLADLFNDLLERNPRAALRVHSAINDQVRLLAEHPALGRPGRVPGTRELVITRTPYIVAYTADARIGAVIVLRVLHGARLWPDEF
jgi:toxin ParE1/3/4